MIAKPKAIILEIDGILSDDSQRRYLIDPKYVPHTIIDGSAFRQHASFYDKETDSCIVPCDSKWKADFKSYHSACSEDLVNDYIAQIIWQMESTVFIYITSRPEKYRYETKMWLFMHVLAAEPPYSYLFMRPDFLPWRRLPHVPQMLPSMKDGSFKDCAGEVDVKETDNRPSHEVKREIYEREIKDKYDILFVLERPGLDSQMYTELGLKVLEVK